MNSPAGMTTGFPNMACPNAQASKLLACKCAICDLAQYLMNHQLLTPHFYAALYYGEGQMLLGLNIHGPLTIIRSTIHLAALETTHTHLYIEHIPIFLLQWSGLAMYNLCAKGATVEGAC
jgi:hypothetical protein